MAEEVIEGLNKAEIYDAPIVTKVEPFKAFHRAEEYHRDYFRRHPETLLQVSYFTKNR